MTLRKETGRATVEPRETPFPVYTHPTQAYTFKEFAKKMELYAVCTESTEQIAAWEACAKEFDVKVAFHEHGGSMSNPKYKVWRPICRNPLWRGSVESGCLQ